jgi:DNA-binding response OmpR family regulator
MNKKILLIEDSIDLLEDLPPVLKTYNLDVISTSNYTEALEHFKEGAIDGVILDLKMRPSEDMSDEETDVGRLTGLIICKRFKDINPSIPIIIITSITDAKTLSRAYKVGADDVIEKPKHPDEIVQRLKQKLR